MKLTNIQFDLAKKKTTTYSLRQKGFVCYCHVYIFGNQSVWTHKESNPFLLKEWNLTEFKACGNQSVWTHKESNLTVLTEPLSRAEEPFIVRQVRRLELALLKRWLKKGLKPVDGLVSDVSQFVKDTSDL
ncbi:hypothetical protein HID58_014037 [Brassica napus]|uniref:(rape) hypothetical protein n=1 Tax=Brassica napus TaxID=3708 RepID=A0A817AUI1_BRANA|nr:hypothetical protein HID58_014037 [Brassica napus]CAF2265307.1 unnamed protein product [Brassica napus]